MVTATDSSCSRRLCRCSPSPRPTLAGLSPVDPRGRRHPGRGDVHRRGGRGVLHPSGTHVAREQLLAGVAVQSGVVGGWLAMVVALGVLVAIRYVPAPSAAPVDESLDTVTESKPSTS